MQYQNRQFKLLRRKGVYHKGVYPYDYMYSLDKFDARLPPIQAFKSKLTGQGISIKDYEHARDIWQAFNVKDMRDYHDLYLKSDREVQKTEHIERQNDRT